MHVRSLVIYLIFTQQESFQAFHLNVATLGLEHVVHPPEWTQLLGVEPRLDLSPVWCVATATLVLFLVTVTSLSRSLDSRIALRPDHVPLAIAVPGAIAAIYAATVCLLGKQATHAVGIKIAAVVLGLVACAFLVRTVQHFTDPQSEAIVTRARAIVVLLDTGELIIYSGPESPVAWTGTRDFCVQHGWRRPVDL